MGCYPELQGKNGSDGGGGGENHLFAPVWAWGRGVGYIGTGFPFFLIIFTKDCPPLSFVCKAQTVSPVF